MIKDASRIFSDYPKVSQQLLIMIRGPKQPSRIFFRKSFKKLTKLSNGKEDKNTFKNILTLYQEQTNNKFECIYLKPSAHKHETVALEIRIN